MALKRRSSTDGDSVSEVLIAGGGSGGEVLSRLLGASLKHSRLLFSAFGAALRRSDIHLVRGLID
jgi:hypothetical protein